MNGLLGGPVLLRGLGEGRQEYCEERVCVSVGPRAYLRNYTRPNLKIFVHVVTLPIPVPRSSLRHARYFRFMDDVIFAHDWPYERMRMPLQRVTSLRRRTQADAPAASYW